MGGHMVKDSPKLSEVFGLLRNARRRVVIDVLRELDETTDLGAVADVLAEIEDDGSSFSARRKRAYISLYQSHMPKLDKAGVVEYDERSKAVERGDAFELVDKILRGADRVRATDQVDEQPEEKSAPIAA